MLDDKRLADCRCGNFSEESVDEMLKAEREAHAALAADYAAAVKALKECEEATYWAIRNPSGAGDGCTDIQRIVRTALGVK